MKDISLTLISDFNLEPLRRFMVNKWPSERLEVRTAPYGQVYQTLSLAMKEKTWGMVVWTIPEHIFPSYARAFNCEVVDHSEVLLEVDNFVEYILSVAKDTYIFLSTWVLPPSFSGYGALDWRPSLGMKHLLAIMNVRLAEKLAGCTNVFLLDTERWFGGVSQPESAKMWYAAKVPYQFEVFERAAEDILSAIDSINGQSRRLILLDLDNTLWGGVVGDTGWEGIRLGGLDHAGEAFKSFQGELKALSNRGIQLAIISKNDEKVAFEAIDNHQEMILRRSDFVGWRINWSDKAENIISLVQELGLGFGSVVFIDDNPAERDRVARALPKVLVPEWPEDPSAYVGCLRALNCFNTTSISDEDRARKSMYVAELARKEIRENLSSLDEWLQQLETSLQVDSINSSNSARIAQLFNKTNQLNLSTRRLAESEIIAWAACSNNSLLAITARDRFGDMGLVGIIGLEVKGGEGFIVDFILSCRVMGRRVEEAMLHVAASKLSKMGASLMKIDYIPTDRNRPTLDVLRNSALTETSPNHFEFLIADNFPRPVTVAVNCKFNI